MANSTILEIALNLYSEKNINFTRAGDGQATPADALAYEGYADVAISGDVIIYSNKGLTLEVAEVTGFVADEDGDATDEKLTLDYLWVTLDADGEHKGAEAGSPEKKDLIAAIEAFMA